MTTLHEVEHYLNQVLINREEEIDSLITAICAGEHILILGPPGTGKSQLVRELAGCVSDAEVFYRLMSYHMPKEELFGPLSLSALREDRYEYKVDGYLPTAHLAYLDEIGKCHPSMLNTMLMILNEREFTNAGKQVKCPLITCIGTSNELFEEGAEALYDRFFFKHSVSYLSKKKDFFRLQEDVRDKEDIPRPIIRIEDIDEVRNRAKSITFPDEIIKGLWKFKTALEEGDNPICVSDRTWAKIQKVAKVRAALADKEEVDATVMGFLSNVCWDKPEDKPQVEAAYRKAFTTPPEGKKKSVMPAADYRAKQKELYGEDSSFMSLVKAKDNWEKSCEDELNKEYHDQNVENLERLVSEGELLGENFKKLWEHSNSTDIRDQAEMYYQDVDALLKSIGETIVDIDMDIEASISSESQFDPAAARTYRPRESRTAWNKKTEYEKELRRRMGRRGGY
jgi:MoxR-like ATPase